MELVLIKNVAESNRCCHNLYHSAENSEVMKDKNINEEKKIVVGVR